MPPTTSLELVESAKFRLDRENFILACGRHASARSALHDPSVPRSAFGKPKIRIRTAIVRPVKVKADRNMITYSVSLNLNGRPGACMCVGLRPCPRRARRVFRLFGVPPSRLSADRYAKPRNNFLPQRSLNSAVFWSDAGLAQCFSRSELWTNICSIYCARLCFGSAQYSRSGCLFTP